MTHRYGNTSATTAAVMGGNATPILYQAFALALAKAGCFAAHFRAFWSQSSRAFCTAASAFASFCGAPPTASVSRTAVSTVCATRPAQTSFDSPASAHAFAVGAASKTVSYTHLTLPTNREV